MRGNSYLGIFPNPNLSMVLYATHQTEFVLVLVLICIVCLFLVNLRVQPKWTYLLKFGLENGSPKLHMTSPNGYIATSASNITIIYHNLWNHNCVIEQLVPEFCIKTSMYKSIRLCSPRPRKK